MQTHLLKDKKRDQIATLNSSRWLQVEKAFTKNASEASVEMRIAELNFSLRWQESQTLGDWSSFALQQIQQTFPELNMIQSALFAITDSDDGRLLQRMGGIALPPDAPHTLFLGEGLVGQSAKDQRSFSFEVTEEKATSPQSAFFRVVAKSMHILPLVYNDQTVGVWELMSLHDKGSLSNTILNKVTGLLTANLAGFLSQLRITNLLLESKVKNEALEKQELILKQKLQEISLAQQQLQGIQAELEEANDTLEAKVDERTATLQETLANLQSTQQQLVMAEKMASLGHLIAGVAHEINTPIGAVKAAASNILDILPGMLNLSSGLIPKLTPIHQSQAASVIEYFLKSDQMLGAKEERTKKRAYQREMEQAGVADADVIADTLVAAGFYESPLPYLELLTGPNGNDVLKYLASQGQMIRNLRNIALAANKTSKVVFALKNFSHMHDAGALVPVNLQENLETVLILYHNQLKQGITVQTEYQDLPYVMGNPDELSQVWTNLIQNAAQAMDHQGKLNIALSRLNNYARVEITDSGKGIPKELQERIFEPFFTTKRRGEGTGLGLDICRKIIEKHQGRISVESRPGRTCFTIEIPIPISN